MALGLARAHAGYLPVVVCVHLWRQTCRWSMFYSFVRVVSDRDLGISGTWTGCLYHDCCCLFYRLVVSCCCTNVDCFLSCTEMLACWRSLCPFAVGSYVLLFGCSWDICALLVLGTFWRCLGIPSSDCGSVHVFQLAALHHSTPFRLVSFHVLRTSSPVVLSRRFLRPRCLPLPISTCSLLLPLPSTSSPSPSSQHV